MKRQAKRAKGLSQAELARQVGCSRSSVQRAIAAGRISPRPDGAFDSDAAETLRTARAADAAAAEVHSQTKAEILTAQRDRLRARARKEQLEADRAAGGFVELALVERDARDTAERIVSVLRALPQRTALSLECPCRRAAVVMQKISDEVERAIGEIGESQFIERIPHE